MDELLEVQHEMEDEAKRAVMEAIEEESDGRWMAAVWQVKDGKIFLRRRTGWRFPRGDYQAAVKHLRDHLQKDFDKYESSRTLPNEPLPMANFLGRGDGEGSR